MSHRPVLSGLQDGQDRGGWPEGALYHSSVGLFGFQADGVARAYWQLAESAEPTLDVLYSTGIGKTHIAMATAALMIEDDLLDQVIIVAEANKVADWAEDDFPTFTTLPVQKYTGSPDRRRKILADPATVLVMTYETGRNDICTFKGKGSKAVAAPGMLTEFLRGKRTLIVFDEVSRLRSRGTALYTAWDYLLNRTLRRDSAAKVMVLGMTATKIENSPEDHFNANRLLAPWRAPSVAQFERDHIASYDLFGNVKDWKNLSAENCEPGVIPLSERWGPVTIKKRKTDPDVIGHFPAKVENPPRYIDLGARHRDFYDAVEDLFWTGEEGDFNPAVFGLMRQISAHPESLLRSKGQMATDIVATVGAQALVAMGSAKTEEMLAWMRAKGDEQSVVFTFFGQSVLPILHERLTRAGYRVSINHGQMSVEARKVSQDAFKAGDTQIFLSSDAGARGLNLGVGSALLHYELPLLYSTFVQRSDRIHRINSVHESVTVDALVAKNTAEEAIANLLLKRNGWSDAVLDDDVDYGEDFDPGQQYLTAEVRKEIWRRARSLAA